MRIPSLAGTALLAGTLACSSPLTGTGPSEDVGTPITAATPAGAIELSPQSCPAASAHVYHPQRLHLLGGCQLVTLTGTLRKEKAEPDGDFHVLLALDPGQKNPRGGAWINAENTHQQKGDLVLEPVCEVSVTQRDAVAACQGYRNPLKLPRVGKHVTVSGYWVFDGQHGWNELHPLTSIQIS
jgi:hypothetical protein